MSTAPPQGELALACEALRVLYLSGDDTQRSEANAWLENFQRRVTGLGDFLLLFFFFPSRWGVDRQADRQTEERDRVRRDLRLTTVLSRAAGRGMGRC